MNPNPKRSQKNFIDNEITRIIINGILTVLVSIFCAFIPEKGKTLWMIIAIIVIVSIQVCLDIRGKKLEDEKNADIETTLQRNFSYKNLFEQLPKILYDQSEGIGKIASAIRITGQISSNRWKFDDATNSICYSIKKFIVDYCHTDGIINVFYVKKIDETKIKMVGISDKQVSIPKINKKERDISESSDAFLDQNLFAKNDITPMYRLKPEDVDKVFKYKNREKDAGKYEQFLFIPVSSDQKNISGMIEIIASKGTILAYTDRSMENLISILKIYISILVLLEKTEEAAIAIPPKKQSDFQ